MNMSRVILGGVVGGVVFNLISLAINVALLGPRYEVLQRQGVFRVDPRLPFLPIWLLLLFLVSIGLVWLYAAARPRLGPGPRTALCIGLTVGLIAGLPGGLAQYSWTHAGGFVVLWTTIERIVGCALATLAGGWIYKE